MKDNLGKIEDNLNQTNNENTMLIDKMRFQSNKIEFLLKEKDKLNFQIGEISKVI